MSFEHKEAVAAPITVSPSQYELCLNLNTDITPALVSVVNFILPAESDTDYDFSVNKPLGLTSSRMITDTDFKVTGEQNLPYEGGSLVETTADQSTINVPNTIDEDDDDVFNTPCILYMPDPQHFSGTLGGYISSGSELLPVASNCKASVIPSFIGRNSHSQEQSRDFAKTLKMPATSPQTDRCLCKPL